MQVIGGRHEFETPVQHGRVAVVTGATGGIGFATALALARHGATLVLACRDQRRASAAADRIGGSVPGASVFTTRLDLASLASIRAAATEIADRHPRIDLLINNAAVNRPVATRTEDGFEAQFGTCHLGHFALTGLLLPRMLEVPGSRVVTVTGLAHHLARMDLDRLDDPRGGLARAKLANLMFSLGLHRRLERASAQTIAVAAHPGAAGPELVRDLPSCLRWTSRTVGGLLFGLTPAKGARPTLRAALDPGVRGGDLYGPGDPMELIGGPARLRSGSHARDPRLQALLWAESERLTGVRYPLPH